MPYNSDYLESTNAEKNSVIVLTLLKELGIKTGYYDSYYGRVKTLSRDVAMLCEACQKVDVKKYSLELQIWWRDHQKADKERIKEELKAIKLEKQKKKAIAKLTPYERKLLGYE